MGLYISHKTERGKGRVNWEKRKRDMAKQLPDKRLEERFERLREQLSQRPEESIPQACGSGHEAKAAYRFLG